MTYNGVCALFNENTFITHGQNTQQPISNDAGLSIYSKDVVVPFQIDQQAYFNSDKPIYIG